MASWEDLTAHVHLFEASNGNETILQIAAVNFLFFLLFLSFSLTEIKRKRNYCPKSMTGWLSARISQAQFSSTIRTSISLNLWPSPARPSHTQSTGYRQLSVELLLTGPRYYFRTADSEYLPASCLFIPSFIFLFCPNCSDYLERLNFVLCPVRNLNYKIDRLKEFYM